MFGWGETMSYSEVSTLQENEGCRCGCARCFGFNRFPWQEIAVAQKLPDTAGQYIRIAMATISIVASVISIALFEYVQVDNAYFDDQSKSIFENIWFYTIILTPIYISIYAYLSRYTAQEWEWYTTILVEVAAFCLHVNFSLTILWLINLITQDIESSRSTQGRLVIRYAVPYICSLIVFWTSGSVERYNYGVAFIFGAVHFVASNINNFKKVDAGESVSAQDWIDTSAVSAYYMATFIVSIFLHRMSTYPRSWIFSLIQFIDSRCGCCCRCCQSITPTKNPIQRLTQLEQL